MVKVLGMGIVETYINITLGCLAMVVQICGVRKGHGRFAGKITMRFNLASVIPCWQYGSLEGKQLNFVLPPYHQISFTMAICKSFT